MFQPAINNAKLTNLFSSSKSSFDMYIQSFTVSPEVSSTVLESNRKHSVYCRAKLATLHPGRLEHWSTQMFAFIRSSSVSSDDIRIAGMSKLLHCPNTVILNAHTVGNQNKNSKHTEM